MAKTGEKFRGNAKPLYIYIIYIIYIYIVECWTFMIFFEAQRKHSRIAIRVEFLPFERFCGPSF